MIQKLPTLLQALQGTTTDEFIAYVWYCIWRDYDVVPWVFDEDGCDDMLKEMAEKAICYEFASHYRFVPQDAIVVDVTACCDDWKPDVKKPVMVCLQKHEEKKHRNFYLMLKNEIAIGPTGSERVFFVFELEEIE